MLHTTLVPIDLESSGEFIFIRYHDFCNMGGERLTLQVEQTIRTLSKEGNSYSVIVKKLKAEGLDVGKATIYRVVNGIGKKREAESNGQKFQVDRPRPVRTPATVSKVKRLATTENPPSQRQLSRMCGTSLKTINNIIHKDLELDTRRKGKVHKLTPFHMKNRATNARKLYEEHLAGSRSEYTATLDEAWMYVTYCNGIRKICYIKRGNQVPDNWVHQCSETFPKGFMVVGGNDWPWSPSAHKGSIEGEGELRILYRMRSETCHRTTEGPLPRGNGQSVPSSRQSLFPYLQQNPTVPTRNEGHPRPKFYQELGHSSEVSRRQPTGFLRVRKETYGNWLYPVVALKHSPSKRKGHSSSRTARPTSGGEAGGELTRTLSEVKEADPGSSGPVSPSLVHLSVESRARGAVARTSKMVNLDRSQVSSMSQLTLQSESSTSSGLGSSTIRTVTWTPPLSLGGSTPTHTEGTPSFTESSSSGDIACPTTPVQGLKSASSNYDDQVAEMSATEFLCRYEEESEKFLDSIVTGDAIWAHHYIPEMKNQSKQWRHLTSPKPKKFAMQQESAAPNMEYKRCSSCIPRLGALTGSTLKRDRDGEFPEIEEALFRWIRQANAMKLAINGNILKEKAILLALKMGQDNFEASNGWLEKFKVRRNIAFKRLHGEAGSVDANSVATWKGGIIPSLLAKYSPQDIFNADETELFYKLLPNQTMTIRGFVMDEAMEEVVEEEMNRCFEALKKHQAIDVNYIEFLEVDKDVQVAGEQSIEEIVKEVMGKEEDEEPLLTWSTNATHPVSLDQESLQGAISQAS
ncbi:TIGD6 [Cordylochernes scorpioides]|uniref:TIGD6 n=1 Tax=Cordylochernes scorpioides TaxID=51811 RepID=A0ABY6LCP7_9ARAC|nr:TIGD6 [Cordylochernes scorpioides]